MKLDTDELRAMGFKDCDDGMTWSMTLLTVKERPDRRSDRHGRQLVVCPEDGACWLNEYDRDGEVTDIVGLPPAPNHLWLEGLVNLIGPKRYPNDYKENG